jgi:hypothetical protein
MVKLEHGATCLRRNVSDDARAQLAERVVEHREQSGFEIEEPELVMRNRPPGAGRRG